jgi:uncharacterized membrane protein
VCGGRFGDVAVAARDRVAADRQGAAVVYDGASGSFLMTPLSHTVYSVGLFLALVALWLWSKRRRRVSEMVKRAVAAMTRNEAA